MTVALPAPVVGPPALQPEDPATTSGQSWLADISSIGSTVLVLLALLLIIGMLTGRAARHRITGHQITKATTTA
jgi:hypothetical protein